MVEPCLRCLTETVEQFVEEVDGVRAFCVNKAGRLLTEHIFLQVSVKKCIGDVELPSRPLSSSCDGKYGADSSWFHHRCESLAEINAGALREPANNPPSLVSLERAIRIQFVFENPLPEMT